MSEDLLVAISERMEMGNIMVFTKADPSVDRLQLVGFSLKASASRSTNDCMAVVAERRNYGAGLYARPGDNSWEPERGTLLYQILPPLVTFTRPQANILIDDHGRARLAGFNLVTVASGQLPAASPPSEDGAIRWMGPELLHPQMFGLNDGSPSTESDCYALGMVIYEVLSGQVPFAKYTDARVARVVLDGERPLRPQGDQGKLFADEIWGVLCLCWKQRPSDRLSAGGVLNGLGGEPPSSLSSSEMDGDTVAGTDDYKIRTQNEDGMFFLFHKAHLSYPWCHNRLGRDLISAAANGQGEGGWAPCSILLLTLVVRALRRCVDP